MDEILAGRWHLCFILFLKIFAAPEIDEIHVCCFPNFQIICTIQKSFNDLHLPYYGSLLRLDLIEIVHWFAFSKPFVTSWTDHHDPSSRCYLSQIILYTEEVYLRARLTYVLTTLIYLNSVSIRLTNFRSPISCLTSTLLLPYSEDIGAQTPTASRSENYQLSWWITKMTVLVEVLSCQINGITSAMIVQW